MVRRIPNLLCTRRCRINLETGIEMGLAVEVGEYALSHGGTTDVAVADEKYFYHLFISPFKSCISSQMPNIAGFFGIFLFLCFRGIFSNLPVFSRAFPCNIGKSVGK